MLQMCSSVVVERFQAGEKELRLLNNQAVVASDSDSRLALTFVVEGKEEFVPLCLNRSGGRSSTRLGEG